MNPVRDYMVSIWYKGYENTQTFKSRSTQFIYGNK